MQPLKQCGDYGFPYTDLYALAVGPTGDIAVGVACNTGPSGPLGDPAQVATGYWRTNGSAALLLSELYTAASAGAQNTIVLDALSFDASNNLYVSVHGKVGYGNPAGYFGLEGPTPCPNPPTTQMYCIFGNSQVVSPGGQLITPPQGIPDGAGGTYVFGPLTSTMNLGCGALTPTSSSSAYVAHLGPTSSCIYSRVLPVLPLVVADAHGAVLSASSSTALDLGCGSLPAASGGSTFVTRLGPTGSCVFGKAFAVSPLTVALDPAGSVVLSGLAGAASVDLGGGPLAPLGSHDVVLGELDVAGNYLWSKRFGAPNITFAGPWVTVSSAGNVYLRTGFAGTVDLGGGPVTAAGNDAVVGSYTPTGAHRWSRDLPITGNYLAGIDGCGSLVLASKDFSFDAGRGPLLNPMKYFSHPAAVVRFAP